MKRSATQSTTCSRSKNRVPVPNPCADNGAHGVRFSPRSRIRGAGDFLCPAAPRRRQPPLNISLIGLIGPIIWGAVFSGLRPRYGPGQPRSASVSHSQRWTAPVGGEKTADRTVRLTLPRFSPCGSSVPARLRAGRARRGARRKCRESAGCRRPSVRRARRRLRRSSRPRPRPCSWNG